MCKFIFVTGGVVSGLGKGITAASLGRLLKARGIKVSSQKLDPYINVDPGTMSPYQHGEVFVTDDVTELEDVLKKVPDSDALGKACYYRDCVLPLMKTARRKADELETMTDRKYWPIPVYRELMFGVD